MTNKKRNCNSNSEAEEYVYTWTVTITIPLTHLCKTAVSSQNAIKKQPTNFMLWHMLELLSVQEGRS